jgi:hypothetical protein
VATDSRNPISDEAASGTLSGTASSRYVLVDDYPDTTPADYLQFGTTTAQITFGFSPFAIPARSTINSVTVQYHDSEPSSGTNNAAGRLKVGGSYYNSATHNPSGTAYTARSNTWATNPKTSAAWTVDQVNGTDATNALQAFGIGSTDSNPTFRVSGVQLVVDYTPPVAISTITDNFDDNSLDVTKWTFYGGPGNSGVVSESGGKVTLTTGTTSGDESSLMIGPADISESCIFVQLTKPVGSSAGLWVFDPSWSSSLGVSIDNTEWIGASGDFGTAGWMEYDPAVHKWLRVRQTGTTWYVEWSTDCTTWTALWSGTQAGLNPTNVKVQLTSSPPAGTNRSVSFDNFNIAPTATKPTISITAHDRDKVSGQSGRDVCTVTFQSDIALQAWEAREAGSGHGTGTLVDSGTTLAANTPQQFTILDEEISGGDGTYRITVYGQSAATGEWSDY